MNIFAKKHKIFILYLNKKSLCCTIRIVKEKVAIITKDTMKKCKERLALIDAVKNDGSFELYEIEVGADIQDGTDMAVVFGGDGTMLDAVGMCAGKEVALLGVNLGNLGFLTSCEKDVSKDALLLAMKEKRTTTRILLEMSTAHGSFMALNEVAIKGKNSCPIFIEMFVDDKFVDRYHGDGAIVATPTGSTAYSLSAGGPILAPDVDALLINPVCAHSLHARPLVVGGCSTVSLKLEGDNQADVLVDGRLLFTLSDGERLNIAKSQKSIQFIAVSGDDFYKKLLTKMNSWGTTCQG